MSIDEVLNTINIDNIVSEQDVRTKVALPILSCLDYSNDNRAEEFPVYGYEGRKILPAKSVDIMLFSSPEHPLHRERDERSWVMNHSLIAIELKKPTENISDSQGQAQFYAMWTRALYYICTNGEQLVIYKLENFLADTEICNCSIFNLRNIWADIYANISYSQIIRFKEPKLEDKQSLLYQDYCLSRVSEPFNVEHWHWQQKIWDSENEDTRKELLPEYLLQDNENIILLSHAGVGKTTCFRYLFQKCIREYLNQQTNRVPIIIYAKFWKRSFRTINEGIKNELQNFLPQLNEEIVKLECFKDRFLLFIDGLDECLTDKDLLLEEIKKIQTSASIKILVSCRTDIYKNELPGFNKFYLALLNDNEQVSISTQILGFSTFQTIYSMDPGLKSLLKTPLYFYMWLSYCKENPDALVPKNITTIYDSFINYLLKDYLAQKGNYHIENISTETIKGILSEFAYLSFNSENQITLNEIIINALSDTLYLKETRSIIFQSGILYEFDGEIDFQQFSIKEYFCAIYISKIPISSIINFIEDNHYDENYHEVIFLMIGLLEKEEHQSTILDYLESNDLHLYIKCLKKRYNFSNKYLNQITKELCVRFFTQVLHSYETIVNVHFAALKNSMYPWIDVTTANDKLKEAKIKGSIDPSDLSVSVELCLFDDKNKIDIDFTSNKPIIRTTKDGKEIEIPILSFTNNKNYYYFNISGLYFGIDCAREIAIEIIKKSIETIIANDLLLLEEPPIMQLCYVDKVFRDITPISIKRDKGIKNYDLSFKNYSIMELEDIFKGIRDYSCNTKSYPHKRISFFVIWFILYKNIKTQIELNKVSFPEMDIIPDPPSGWVWDHYSIDCIVDWLKNYHDEFQKAYRLFVDKFFPTIKNNLGMYKVGPIQYKLLVIKPPKEQKGFGNSGGLHTRWFPKESLEECATTIEVAEDEKSSGYVRNDRDYFDTLSKHMQFFNRKLDGFFYESDSTLFHVFDRNNSVRTGVYHQIKDDLNKIGL